MPLSQTPAYNLKAVLKETGIAADTLRAWERRYGLPKPQRSPGGHRLYSQRDIHLIRWLMARQAEGLSISRAIDLWHELDASDADPLAQPVGSAPLPSGVPAPASLEALRRDWVSACLFYDETAAERTCRQALALYPVETVVTELIQAGLSEVGDMWHRGRASVQQEHFASALATRRLHGLLTAAPDATHDQAILLACPAGEWHAFPLLELSLLLRRRGWETIYFGADVPIVQLQQTAQAVGPSLAILSAQRLASAASLRDTAEALVASGIPVAFGGRIFNQISELQDRIAGEFIGASIQAAPARIEELLNDHISPNSATVDIHHPLAAAYRLNLLLIEGTARREFDQLGISASDFETAAHHMGNALGAALDLGDIAYLATDLDWMRSLSDARAVPVEGIRSFLGAYSRAVQQVMGPAASEITDWLDHYLSAI